MNEIEKAIKKLRSADSHHTQAQYNLDDETIELAIEALEKQMLKKSVITEIEKALAYLKDSIKYAEKCSNASEVKSIINTAITVLEKQLNGGWISSKNRLPKERGFYIFQLNDGRVHEYYYANEILYGDCDRQFDEPIEEVVFNLNDVLAWQPLPEPYKEVENE